MRVAALSDGLRRAWRGLRREQRLTAVAATGLIASTLGPFGWIEAAQVVAALAVLAMLQRRIEGRAFELPFGDGGATALAGGWCALLVLVRIGDRPLLQTALGLGCAAAMIAAGLRLRSRRR